MATLKSFLKMSGSLGGLVIYERNGQFFVKGAGGADKKRILTEPNFQRTRENMQEFGAAAILGKTFRQGFMPIAKSFRTGTLSGKVTGMMKRINKAGPGERGARSFEIVKQGSFIEGFEVNQKKSFSSVFYPTYNLPEINFERSQVIWEIPPFQPLMSVNPPNEATHFQLILHVFGLSDYVYEHNRQAYVFLYPRHNEVRNTAGSANLALNSKVNEGVRLSVDLPVDATTPVNKGIIISIGVLFFEEINGTPSLIPGQNAMKVARIV